MRAPGRSQALIPEPFKGEGSPVSTQRLSLPGGRVRFLHGPMDLVIAADGEPAALCHAHEHAWARFQPLLAELVSELPLLRQPVAPGVAPGSNPLSGPVARRMWQACASVRQAAGVDFITPMAAVAGAVADEIVGCYRAAGVQRAAVNNGGDIALHLSEGAEWRLGLVADIAQQANTLDGRCTIRCTDSMRGVATSGWRGRSHSLGIADSATVLAASSALADAAATLVANAVNVADPRIQRAPATSLKDDSDLGERLVTTHVPPLPAALCQQALRHGLAVARRLFEHGLIHDAVLVCQGQVLTLHDAAGPPWSMRLAA